MAGQPNSYVWIIHHGQIIAWDERRVYTYNDKSGLGDIYYSDYLNGQFSPIVAVKTDKVNTQERWETHYTVSADGNSIFFVSDREDGYGKRDISSTLQFFFRKHFPIFGNLSKALCEPIVKMSMDLHMKNYGGLDLEPSERKNYRKICYFLGIMINAKGKRFLDEGKNFRNYTYEKKKKKVLDQPGHFAWQIFDSKVFDLLYEEYTFHDAHFVEADTIDDLIKKMDNVDKIETKKTISEFNNSVDLNTSFDPTVLDGKSTNGIEIKKSN